MPTLPLLATPAADSPATCATCGSTLMRTGKPITFGDIESTPGRKVEGLGLIRGQRAFRGWVPSLLVTICPVCDGRIEDDVTVEPPLSETHPCHVPGCDTGSIVDHQDHKSEGFLARLGRQIDEREKENSADA